MCCDLIYPDPFILASKALPLQLITGLSPKNKKKSKLKPLLRSVSFPLSSAALWTLPFLKPRTSTKKILLRGFLKNRATMFFVAFIQAGNVTLFKNFLDIYSRFFCELSGQALLCPMLAHGDFVVFLFPFVVQCLFNFLYRQDNQFYSFYRLV